MTHPSDDHLTIGGADPDLTIGGADPDLDAQLDAGLTAFDVGATGEQDRARGESLGS